MKRHGNSNEKRGNTAKRAVRRETRPAEFYLALAVLLSFLLLSIFHVFSAATTTVRASGVDAGINLELPTGKHLRVVNERGETSVEVWKEKYLYVEVSGAAGVAPSANINRSRNNATRQTAPVSFNRSAELLTVLADNSPNSSVNLTLKIPADTLLEVSSVSGTIDLRGAAAQLKATNGSGAIRFDLNAGENTVNALSDANVFAETRDGSITTTSGDVLSSSRNDSGARIYTVTRGAGVGSRISLRTASGRITLPASLRETGQTATSTNQSTNQQPRRPPTLIGANPNNASPNPNTTTGVNSAGDDDDDVIRIDTELVTVNVSVVEQSTNRGIADLKQPDFVIYEDNVEQQLQSFESSQTPFDLILLIDFSASTRDVADVIRAAAERFVDAARPQDRIGIIAFAASSVVVSDLTIDRASLKSRIRRMEQPRGGTKLYDAIDFTLKMLARERDQSRRKAVVLMSDGLDSGLPNVAGDGSTVEFEDLKKDVEEFDGILYAVWLNTEYDAVSDLDVQPETFDLAYDRTKGLAEAGGGAFYEIKRLSDLSGAYERVVADLGTLYSLSYKPTNEAKDGTWRRLRVRVSRPNARARGKSGYRAKLNSASAQQQ